MHEETQSQSRGLFLSFPTPAFLRFPAAGLDVSDRTIKYVLLGTGSQGTEVLSYDKTSIEPGVVEQGKIIDREKFVSVLKNLAQKGNFRYVHASLPEEHSYLFQTNIEKTNEQEVRSLIEFSLKDNVPLPQEQIVFDYKVFSESETTSGSTVVASVSVYPIDIINQYMLAFKEAGIIAVSFEVEAQAVARSVIAAEDTGTYMIVDIGRSKAGLSIYSNGIIMFSATLEVGGDDLSSALEKQFNVSTEDAEKLKNERGFVQGENNSELLAALSNTMAVFRDEVMKHIGFWKSEQSRDDSIEDIERIILCGGNANLAGLPEYLEAAAGTPVVRANVWENTLDFDAHIPEIPRRYSLEYATAIGLALRAIQKR